MRRKKIAGKLFDQNLLMMKGAAAYKADKVKAARMGGAASKPNLAVCKANGEAAGLARRKYQIIGMTVLCKKDFKTDDMRYLEGGKYRLTIDTGDNTPQIITPFRHQFQSWMEFLAYFKRFKERKQDDRPRV